MPRPRPNPSRYSARRLPLGSASTGSTQASASGWATNGSTWRAYSSPPSSPRRSTPPYSSDSKPRAPIWVSTAIPRPIYVRSLPDQVNAVYGVLAATANPESPSDVTLSRPSDALVARAKAKSAFNGLFLGLGAVALLVGAVGVANIMVISVLERRSEIGLRRARASKGHIRIQFLAEATLLALAGGAAGVAAGAAATATYATANHWAIVIPTTAWAGGLAATLLIGVIAGLMPAIRAARMSPTRALWSV